MREILFRGKRVDNGEWVCGDLVRHYENQRVFILTEQLAYTTTEYGISRIVSERYFEVIPGTAGQYTGMVDRNGKKIFEGDVVSAWSQGVHAKGKIAQRIDGYWIMYPSYQENIMWYLAPDADGRTDIEIIGNIHDEEEEND